MEIKNNIQTFYASSRKEWRCWLQQNANTEKQVWLIIYHKQSKTPSIYYDAAVEEAICFGWIDSKPNKRDNESYYLFFSQRKFKSNWSKANRQRAEKMIAQNLMMPSGLALIQIAKQTGTWQKLEAVQNTVIPADLAQLLKNNTIAFQNFTAFAPSSKRIILEWILNAKKTDTRKKRIEETVALAEKNIKANHYKQ